MIKTTGKVPILWMETTKYLIIFLDLFVCLFSITYQMLGPTGEKKKKRNGAGSGWFGHSFADLCVFTLLWFVVNGVVYLGMQL